MLDAFLETNLQNKLKILSVLHSNSTVLNKKLRQTLQLSPSGLGVLIDEMNSDFENLAVIEKRPPHVLLTVCEGVHFFHLFRSLCRSSSMLRCLKFLILNDSNQPFSEFTANEYLAKSNAYRIRKTCCNYLQCIGLNIEDNRVIGEEYRIRFLIALLHYKYGIDCYDLDDDSLRIEREFVLSTNQEINMAYLEQADNEYGYFEYLLTLAWKRKKYPVGDIKSEQLDNLKKMFIYGELKKALKKTLEPMLHIHFDESDCNYIYLVYCCTNSCLFADKWLPEDIQQVHDIFYSDAAFSDLLQRFGKKFGNEVQNSLVLKAALIYFFKKCLLDLQCIIPDNNFLTDAHRSELSLALLNFLTDFLNEWREDNGIKYRIDSNHLLYLSLQIEFVLHQFTGLVQVIVVSDVTAELAAMEMYLRKIFSEKRITVIPILINVHNKRILLSQKDSVIIVNKKFERIVSSLGLGECNTVIPVTVEMNDSDIDAINNAVKKYEEARFLKFIYEN